MQTPTTEIALARARTLCEVVGGTDELSRALSGLAAFYQVRGELEDASDIAKKLLDLAERKNDSSLAVWGHLALGSPLMWRG